MSVPITNQEGSVSGDSSGSAICAACGKEFGCSANACDTTPTDCWCFAVKLNESAIAELQSRYRGCLCNKCLVAFARDVDDVQPGVQA